MTRITRWRPTEWLTRRGWDLDDLRDDMDRLRDRVERGFDSWWDKEWSPRADLTETKDSYVVKADVPDMGPDDVDVRFDEGRLVISGERKTEEKKEDENAVRTERFHGKFERSFVLPGAVKEDKINASCKNGVLTVTVPKAEASPEKKGRKIPVS